MLGTSSEGRSHAGSHGLGRDWTASASVMMRVRPSPCAGRTPSPGLLAQRRGNLHPADLP